MQITLLKNFIKSPESKAREEFFFRVCVALFGMSAVCLRGNSQIGARSSKCTCLIKTITRDNSFYVNKLYLNVNIVR